MAASEMPSIDMLSTGSVNEIMRFLERYLRSISANERPLLELSLQRAYRKACYEGDLERVSFFISDLRSVLPDVATKLLSDKRAISWAAYGGKTDVICLICSKQSDADFLGHDYCLALSMLALAGEDENPDFLIDEYLDQAPEDVFASSLAVVCHAVRQQRSTEFLRALKPYLGDALDRQITHQIQN